MYEIVPGNSTEWPGVVVAYSAACGCNDYIEPRILDFLPDAWRGVRDASRRHDALARRKYVKPFKWFKFNRARKATAK